jgi:hypothetical protein
LRSLTLGHFQFQEDSAQVQLQMLTAVVKLFLKVRLPLHLPLPLLEAHGCTRMSYVSYASKILFVTRS